MPSYYDMKYNDKYEEHTLDCTKVVAGSQILNYLCTQKIHRTKRPKKCRLDFCEHS